MYITKPFKKAKSSNEEPKALTFGTCANGSVKSSRGVKVAVTGMPVVVIRGTFDLDSGVIITGVVVGLCCVVMSDIVDLGVVLEGVVSAVVLGALVVVVSAIVVVSVLVVDFGVVVVSAKVVTTVVLLAVVSNVDSDGLKMSMKGFIDETWYGILDIFVSS